MLYVSLVSKWIARQRSDNRLILLMKVEVDGERQKLQTVVDKAHYVPSLLMCDR